ncbi:MAG: choline/carnitine O-acyltransferase [Arachnia sp.]
MKYLPVPPLRQSLERCLKALRPLLDDSQMQGAQAAVDEFATVDGPQCQSELERFADLENAEGRSWLSQDWLSSYLVSRDPLPLSSNVGFRIHASVEPDGIGRAADTIHRAAAVHLSWLRGEIKDEINPRGNPMDMHQWRVLAGGLRHPQLEMDTFITGRPGADSREIGVLFKGRLHMMPISDASGQPLSRRVLGDAMERLQKASDATDDTFTHLSYLGSDKAAAYLDALLQHPENAAVYDRLLHAVFLVNITDVPASKEEHQERVTFHVGQAWAYKPFTYQVSLVDDFVGVHIEHSSVDGVTLRSMVEVMQGIDPEDVGDHARGVDLEPVDWHMSEDLRTQLARDVETYRREASEFRVRILHVPVGVPPDLLLSVSHDALQQFSLLYAQVVTYGKVRSVYEAVDMREFQAGRTECLRPVTNEALTLVHALIAGTATHEILLAALAAHKEQVIACKTGQGFDRHLLGLALMAKRMGLEPTLHSDEGYLRLTADFLSTTSVGGAEQITRFTFAPTTTDGIGVNYTLTHGPYEFCLSFRGDKVKRIDEFIQGIHKGVDALGVLLKRTGAS